MTTTSLGFKNITHFGEDLFLNELETNMKVWLDSSYMHIGAWFDINTPSTSGAYGGDFSSLRSVEDPNYTNGQVWQGIRKDWVWETGINYTGEAGTVYDPVQVSGVTVGGSSIGSGDYTVNYPLGRIIFDTAQSTTAAVKANYSFRNVQTYRADDAPWWTQLQYKTFRPDDIHFTQTELGRGDWSIGSHHRIQLPAIILEAVPRGESHGYELGNTSLLLEQDVLYHVVAEDRYTRNKLIDQLRAQEDRTIWLFSSYDVAASGDYPLDHRGEKVNNNMYEDFVNEGNGHRWKKCSFTNATISEVESLNPRLHEGTVRITHEIVFGTI